MRWWPQHLAIYPMCVLCGKLANRTRRHIKLNPGKCQCSGNDRGMSRRANTLAHRCKHRCTPPQKHMLLHESPTKELACAARSGNEPCNQGKIEHIRCLSWHGGRLVSRNLPCISVPGTVLPVQPLSLHTHSRVHLRADPERSGSGVGSGAAKHDVIPLARIESDVAACTSRQCQEDVGVGVDVQEGILKSASLNPLSHEGRCKMIHLAACTACLALFCLTLENRPTFTTRAEQHLPHSCSIRIKVCCRRRQWTYQIASKRRPDPHTQSVH